MENVDAAAADATSSPPAPAVSSAATSAPRRRGDAEAELSCGCRRTEVHRRGRPDRQARYRPARDINTEDVTEEAVDLDARIATQRARVDSGRRLLAQAKTSATW